MANNVDEHAETPVQRIKLEASDGVILSVDRDVAVKSRLLARMLDDLGISDTDDGSKLEEALPVTNCDGQLLQKLMDYCALRRNVAFVSKADDDDQTTVLDADDEAFLDVTDEELVKIIHGANYLDIPDINDIAAQKIANMLEGKSTEQMREVLQQKDDLPEETKQELDERFKWID